MRDRHRPRGRRAVDDDASPPRRRARPDPRRRLSWSDSHWPITLGGGVNLAVPRWLWIAIVVLPLAAITILGVATWWGSSP